MQVAFLAVAGYVVLTAACFGALMSLAGRMQRRATAPRPTAGAAEDAPPERFYAGA